MRIQTKNARLNNLLTRLKRIAIKYLSAIQYINLLNVSEPWNKLLFFGVDQVFIASIERTSDKMKAKKILFHGFRLEIIITLLFISIYHIKNRSNRRFTWCKNYISYKFYKPVNMSK